MKLAVSWSLYDSASSRAHAPQAGAAEKSINSDLFWDRAVSSAASTSLVQLTSIGLPLFDIDQFEGGALIMRHPAVLSKTKNSIRVVVPI